ncbi:MAG: acetylglutamate kinase [Chloroflexi bacterium RBG_13_51_52]|nr:MAG: acetylglutamate kinase [Chloroflexi bacterium RBG_13_51_52]
MKNITVIKIGGSTFSSRDTTIEDIVSLQKKDKPLVVVHGGGSTVTGWLNRQGITTKFVRGERVTDLPSLEVVTAVLAGLVNKEITAAVNIRGGRAVGISGVDGSLIESRMKDKDMGYVGLVEKVNPAILEVLLKDGFVPVVSPVSLYSLDRPVGAPGIMNVNGDPIAGELVAALGAKRLIFLTDVEGIKDKSGNIISQLAKKEAEAMIASGVIDGGMIPKVNACIKALNAGAITRIIDGRKPHALLKEVENGDGGTTIIKLKRGV